MKNGSHCDEDKRNMPIIICGTDVSLNINSAVLESSIVTEDPVLQHRLEGQLSKLSLEASKPKVLKRIDKMKNKLYLRYIDLCFNKLNLQTINYKFTKYIQ